MSSLPTRKIPRFYVVNPITDRRTEVRFESREKVTVQDDIHLSPTSAAAFDIGRRGLKIQLPWALPPGTRVDIDFNHTRENIRCFGRVVWSAPLEAEQAFDCGVEILAWHGIVEGPDSWRRVKGAKLKRDRRRQDR